MKKFSFATAPLQYVSGWCVKMDCIAKKKIFSDLVVSREYYVLPEMKAFKRQVIFKRWHWLCHMMKIRVVYASVPGHKSYHREYTAVSSSSWMHLKVREMCAQALFFTERHILRHIADQMTNQSNPNIIHKADLTGTNQRRATNREAAKASRLRKKLQLEQLEINVLQLTQHNKDLLEENQLLRQKVNNYISLDQYRALISQQEAQQRLQQQRLQRLQAAEIVSKQQF